MNLWIILIIFPYIVYATLYPIQFAISATKVVESIPEKTQDFAHLIPGMLSTYVYSEESDYYADYRRSYFAYTMRKAGWDCMRHYEILANGCIPYFLELEEADPHAMPFLPRDLILEAMNLPGVSPWSPRIDHTVFDKKRYFEILEELLAHMRQKMTTEALARYVLESMNYRGDGEILYVSESTYPDYLSNSILIGLKELMGDRIVDVPQIPYIYTNYPLDIKKLYGKGMSYTRIVEDFPVDRQNIEERIRAHEFDLVIYGSIHKGLRWIDLVLQHYGLDEIVYLCGEDAHACEFKDLPHLFLREFDLAYKTRVQ